MDDADPEAEAQGDGAADERRGARVTMTDVARHAGCSQSTVSVVLNGTPGIRISRTTRRRVTEAVAALGYRHQKSLPRSDAGVRQIAAICDRIDTGPEAAAIDGAREAAWETGHVVAAYQTGNDTEVEARIVDMVLRNRVEAVLCVTAVMRQANVPEALSRAGIPVVMLNCFAADRRFPAAVPAEVAGGREATAALLAAGHRRIAHITGEMWMDAARDRLLGYREALEAAGIAYDAALVREGNWLAGSGYRHGGALMALAEPPTAIFCASDRMAVGCYRALAERGLRFPGNVSVVGYGDDELARDLDPPLTTVRLPHREMGRWAVRQALAPLPEPGGKQQPVRFECTLVERRSVGAPRSRPGIARSTG